MSTNPLLQLKEAGQSVWLDNLSRPLITGGELQRLIREDGITGITSNPTIFKNAMTGSDAYDAQLATLSSQGLSTLEIYEALRVLGDRTEIPFHQVRYEHLVTDPNTIQDQLAERLHVAKV